MYNSSTKYPRFFRGMLALAVLSLYLISSTELSSIHELIHADEHVSHSASDESNACHRAVYHNQKDACSHKSHISAKAKCSLCDHIPATDATLHQPETYQAVSIVENPDTHIFSSPAVCITVQLPARAPPFC